MQKERNIRSSKLMKITTTITHIAGDKRNEERKMLKKSTKNMKKSSLTIRK